MRIARRIGLVVLLVLAVLVVIAVPFSAGGTWKTRPWRPVYLRRPGLPAWTRTCKLGPVSKNTTVCARIRGRIVWVQHHDPDGDGDRHIAVVTRFHVRLIKVQRSLRVPALPGRGSEIGAIGWDLHGGSGRQEIDASLVSFGGHTYLRGRPR